MDKELTEQLKKESEYIGDGLYAHLDGYQIRLFSSNGREILEQIFLNTGNLSSFYNYVERLKKNIK